MIEIIGQVNILQLLAAFAAIEDAAVTAVNHIFTWVWLILQVFN
jgi:hypothetical protein